MTEILRKMTFWVWLYGLPSAIAAWVMLMNGKVWWCVTFLVVAATTARSIQINISDIFAARERALRVELENAQVASLGQHDYIELGERLLPIWSRHVDSVRNQSEGAIEGLTHCFAELVHELDATTRAWLRRYCNVECSPGPHGAVQVHVFSWLVVMSGKRGREMRYRTRNYSYIRVGILSRWLTGGLQYPCAGVRGRPASAQPREGITETNAEAL